METKFDITTIDSLGQGVSKITDKVTFVSKTLKGESGRAVVYREAKGVRFSYLEDVNDLSNVSEHRVTPECDHFNQCNGCHYLHTTYDNEIEIKLESFKSLFRHLNLELNIGSIPSDKRLYYRNRIQLHYNKKLNLLGFINKFNKKIVKVPNCKILESGLSDEFNSLYGNNSWKNLVKNAPNKGHIEIYKRSNGEVKVAVNKRYSDGGFTQVNAYGNAQLQKLVSSYSKDIPESDLVLDLFGGSGNLSRDLSPRNTTVVDYSDYSKDLFKEHQNYIQMDLYDEQVIDLLVKKVGNVDTLIIDPPRKGFAKLPELVKELGCKNIIYISCNPATMVRDISPLLDVAKIEDIQLVDLFPSTYHFESAIFLKC